MQTLAAVKPEHAGVRNPVLRVGLLTEGLVLARLCRFPLIGSKNGLSGERSVLIGCPESKSIRF